MKRFVVALIASAQSRDLWEDKGWPPVTDEPKINLTDFQNEFIFKEDSKRIKPLVEDFLNSMPYEILGRGLGLSHIRIENNELIHLNPDVFQNEKFGQPNWTIIGNVMGQIRQALDYYKLETS